MKKLIESTLSSVLLVITVTLSLLCFPLSTVAYADEGQNEIVEDNKTVHVIDNGSTSADITIDGYYDDWEDKPMGMITWHGNNGESNHNVSFIKDDNYIYIYARMHPSYHSAIPIYSINLSVNGRMLPLFLGYANSQNTTDWSRPVKLDDLGIYLDLHPFYSYPNNSLGDAAVTVTKGNPNDQMEIRININTLENVMGLSAGTINNGSELELNMPNIGEGTLKLLGTSTGSVLGIILCIGFVLIVKLRRSKKAGLA